MNLEEAVRRSFGQNCAEVFVLEACAGQTGDRVSRKAEQARGFRVRKFEHCVHGLSPLSVRSLSAYDAVSEPVLPPGTWMEVQVPCWTNFQELP
jgi:hypothetical protein